MVNVFLFGAEDIKKIIDYFFFINFKLTNVKKGGFFYNSRQSKTCFFFVSGLHALKLNRSAAAIKHHYLIWALKEITLSFQNGKVSA